jgi:hypothetical protein
MDEVSLELGKSMMDGLLAFFSITCCTGPTGCGMTSKQMPTYFAEILTNFTLFSWYMVWAYWAQTLIDELSYPDHHCFP